MATGIRGNDCPVPKGSLFGIISASEHDAWCDCMFTGNADLLAKCKLKAEATSPDTWKYIPLPWTDAGKAARGLEGGGLIGAAYTIATDVAQDTMRGQDPQVTGQSAGTAVVNLVTGNTRPAGAGGPTQLATGAQVNINPNAIIKGGRGMTLPGFTSGGVPSGGGGMPYFPAPSGSSMGLLIGAGALALGALFFMKKRSYGGFGGYRRRRRSRR